MGDPVVIRQVLRKIGVERIIVTPEGDGWRFEGTADFGASFAQRRSSAPPPTPPPPVTRGGLPSKSLAPAEPVLEA